MLARLSMLSEKLDWTSKIFLKASKITVSQLTKETKL